MQNSTFKVAIGQINPTIGDLSGNIAMMLAAARRARDDGANLIVFPELSLTGYSPGDLLDDEDFRTRLAKAAEELRLATRETPYMHWVVGLPIERPGRGGKRFFNALQVLKNGEVKMQQFKQLLPTYGVFDERRHFEPGPDVAKVLRIGATQIGFLVCEDGWNDEEVHYSVNPFQRLADAAVDLVISINASPSQKGKRAVRHGLMSKAAARHGLPLLYVAQVGGHDQLVYDGASFAVDGHGKIVYEATRFGQEVTTLCFDPWLGIFADAWGKDLPHVAPEGLCDPAFYREQIKLGMRDYMRRCGFDKVVVGCSGGIDSAVTLALSVEALGKDKVNAIAMPSRFSSPGSISDSQALCDNLGIPLHVVPITSMVDEACARFEAAFRGPPTGIALENLQARIRGTLLMTYSNQFGHLVLTTGNKSELSVGYCTLYGDTNGGLGLIGDCYKTEVFALAKHINETAGRNVIPTDIIVKPPSAELAPGQKDSDSLPPYEVLDDVLKVLIEGDLLEAEESKAASVTLAQLSATDEGRATIEKIKRLISRSEYKRRQAAPIIRLRARAFGSGRQLPIAAKHY